MYDMWNSIKNYLIRRLIDVNVNELDFSKYDNSADVEYWVSIYENRPPWEEWNDHGHQVVFGRGLGAAIVSELARKVTVEMKSEVIGGERGDYLNRQYQPLVERSRRIVEQLLVQGGGILKPFVSNGRIGIQYMSPGSFIPLRFNDFDELVSVAFLDKVEKDGYVYTKVETHDLSDNGVYTITNKLYLGRGTKGKLGQERPLSEIDKWAHLEPEFVSEDIEQPLYVYIKTPFSNNKDIDSNLGVSVFSKIEGLIKDYDRIYSRMIRDYRLAGLRIYVDYTLINGIDYMETSGKTMPGTGRLGFEDSELYTMTQPIPGEHGDNDGMKDFNPSVNYESYREGLSDILRRIEFNVGLGYGVLSEVGFVAKTATEVVMGDERTHSTVADIQKQVVNAYRDIVKVMDKIADLDELAPKGNGVLEVTFDFDDGVVPEKIEGTKKIIEISNE